MKGEVVTDGIRFTFTDAFYTSNQATNAYGSFVRQFNGDAWCTVNNDSYLNMHFKLEADSSIYGVQLLVRVGTTGDEDTTPALANLFGVETNALTGIGADGTTETSYDALPAGEYTFSISFADLLADYPDQLAMLEEGAPFVFHQLFVRADDSCAATDEVALTVYDVSVTTAPVYSSNVYDDLVEDPTTSSGTSSSSSSTSSASSSTASRTQSTSSQVDTGDAVMPIIGVAALAVVATSAVIVSKKRK